MSMDLSDQALKEKDHATYNLLLMIDNELGTRSALIARSYSANTSSREKEST